MKGIIENIKEILGMYKKAFLNLDTWGIALILTGLLLIIYSKTNLIDRLIE